MPPKKVKETVLYDRLGVDPSAADIDIKKAYRKQAIRLHPDKNPDDPTAHERFQQVGEAYQILSNDALRKAYDEHGMEGAKPDSGFQDPSEMFNTIFGGEAFVDWVGEISMLRDMTKGMEISMRHEEENAREDAAATATATDASTPLDATKDHTTSTGVDADFEKLHVASNDKAAASPAQARPTGIPTRLAIQDNTSAAADSAEQAARDKAAGVTEEEKQLRAKEKKKGALTKEQREELLAFELERDRVRTERVETLTKKLLDRISLWTETDKGKDVTAAFRAKMELEAETLKMESFGIEILHAIGATYARASNTFLKSHKPIIGSVAGIFSRIKDKLATAGDIYGTVTTAVSAQMEIADMAKMEEAGGESWTAEKKDEYERRVTGKILAAAWRGSRYEIQSVLRDVCTKILYDKSVRTEKRLERAHALQLIADVFVPAQRSAEEDNEMFMFEQLVKESSQKKKTSDNAAAATPSAGAGAGGSGGGSTAPGTPGEGKSGLHAHLHRGKKDKEKEKNKAGSPATPTSAAPSATGAAATDGKTPLSS